MQIDRDTTIKLAREAGIVFDDAAAPFYERFAKLVAEHEREACAQLVEELPAPSEYSMTDQSMWDVTCIDCAAAIRARGNHGKT